MKIAVISDIHGNHVALEAVLKEAKSLDIKHLLVLGDIVGYYYHPDKVIKVLEDWSKDMIKGNHEVLMEKVINDKLICNDVIKNYGHGIKIALKKINKKAQDRLFKLNMRKSIELDGLLVELCHGSPWDVDLYIYPDSNIEILKRCAINGADFVFMGHTHRAFVFHQNNIIIANVGSVGQNREKVGIATWVLLNTDNKTLIFKHTPYNVKNLINEVKRIDQDNPYLWKVLMR